MGYGVRTNVKWELTPARLFLAVGLAGALAIGVATPPFEVADETAHFLRAFQVSEGRFLPETHADRVGGELPVALRELITRTSDGIPFHPARRVATGELAAAWSIALRPGERVFLEFPNSAQLHFVPYLPQAAGIAVARRLDDRPMVLLYAARFANLAVASLLILWALRCRHALAWVLAFIALTPIGLQLRASVSADALTTALALAFAAAVAEIVLGEGALSWRPVATGLALGVLLILAKPVYAPLLLAVAAVPAARFASRLRHAAFLALFAGAALLSILLAMQASLRVQAPFRPDLVADRTVRIAELTAHPLAFVEKAAQSWIAVSPRVAMQAMGGNLGWLDTRLPAGVAPALFVLLLLVAVLDAPREGRVRFLTRASCLVAAVGALLALAAAQYVNWTPPGALRVQGLQGRYLHPILPFLLATLSRSAISGRSRRGERGERGEWNARLRRTVPWLVTIATVSGICVALYAIWGRYYGP